ncbi:hypothetical protein M9H77_17148 [Catharanthus roseus]|uniref:Uncharacterized protein n=2 Tax=Catharanthus roseus TaxID=4058 RepID=A0ACC0B3R9_CATRO|nr:hypothetical protein M9H77_17147 [Catharanthus roseus]KAI5667295.1 hypothetical protein M9H77_17148 [Catharanthus roseus]
MENEESLCYKLYKTIIFLPSTSFLIQSQSFNFLTTTCGTKPNRKMKAKGEDMGKELSILYEDKSEFMWLLFCGKKIMVWKSFKTSKAHSSHKKLNRIKLETLDHRR